ncbi:hypothetical protein GJ698_17160 [Pseudoduganella sp. FT26W]|uniref:Uncharacterized protein n=1 Tax=Duganella aquatilis TaxID=2666082 RepID=A0A844CYB4_9BURK|nr:hypothetical protein [Duganella aquatilis]MRW85807.1 hypothetical protein [Duganella aquatilis]
MKILEFVALTFSPQLPDGRYVFRPWGARGPCYLLSAQQRAARAWIQLALYGAALGGLWFLPLIADTMQDLVIFCVTFMLLNYVLFWLFSLGLPTTEKPPRPTPEQRRTAMAAISRSVGRPVLRVLLVISCLFVCAGGAMAFFLDEWITGLLCLLFFGACAATFRWQLSLL